MAKLEHLNVTVKDTHATAKMLCDLIGWEVSWEGASIHDGYSLHLGPRQATSPSIHPPKIQRLLARNTTFAQPSTTQTLSLLIWALLNKKSLRAATSLTAIKTMNLVVVSTLKMKTASRLKLSHMLKPNSLACYFVCPALKHAHLAILCHILF
jgi:hypothetical protein